MAGRTGARLAALAGRVTGRTVGFNRWLAVGSTSLQFSLSSADDSRKALDEVSRFQEGPNEGEDLLRRPPMQKGPHLEMA